jgi:hypothetical protein
MRPSSFRLKGFSVSDRWKIQRVSDSTLTQAVPAPALTTSPERAEDTRRSRPCEAFGVSAPGVAPETDAPYALSGYGLATFDNVLNLNLELLSRVRHHETTHSPGGESCVWGRAGRARRVQIWALKWAS